MLSAVQDAIQRQRIDGKRFDDMLKSNAMQDLGVPALNPRLGVAIRRAWNTDFAQARFIPHQASQPSRTGAPADVQPALAKAGSRDPPPYSQRIGSGERRARGPLVTMEDYSAANLACRLKKAADPDFYEGTLDNRVQPRAPAPSSFAPAETDARNAACGSVVVDNVPSTGKSQPGTGPPGSGGLGDVFAPRAPAPNSFAAPEIHTKAPRSRRDTPDGRHTGSLGDIFEKKPPAPHSFAAPEVSGRPLHSRHGTPTGGDPWAGVSLGDALASAAPRHAQGRFGAEPSDAGHAASGTNTPTAVGSQPTRRQPANAAGSWEGASLGDVLGPRKPVSHTYGESGANPTTDRQPPVAVAPDPWAGVSLGDALGAPPKAPERPPPEPRRTPVAVAPDPWAGVSLGDALGAPPKAPERPPPEPRKAARGGGAPAGGTCDKSPTEIIVWLRTLPESHVPEQAREEIVKIVDGDSLNGDAFTRYIQAIPPEVCAPKHGMKLKAAWKNVLMEAEARAICKQNFDAAAKCQQKGVAITC